MRYQIKLNHEIVQNNCYVVAVMVALAGARVRQGRGAESTKKVISDALGVTQKRLQQIETHTVGEQGVREVRRMMAQVVRRLADIEPKWEYRRQQCVMEAIQKLKELESVGSQPTGNGEGCRQPIQVPNMPQSNLASE